MLTYYILVVCENCDEDIYYGPCGSFIVHKELPVIPYDTASQNVLECDYCGAQNYIGDPERETVGGSIPAEDSDEKEVEV